MPARNLEIDSFVKKAINLRKGASMPAILDLNERKIERACEIVRGQLVALQAYQDEMTKEQVLKVCKDIISGMLDILEMDDR
jgi:hypothetical protein